MWKWEPKQRVVALQWGEAGDHYDGHRQAGDRKEREAAVGDWSADT